MQGSSNKAIISKTPENIGSSQTNWERSLFDDAIFDKGYNAFIERAMKCPCKTKGAKQALSSCQNCGGSGWFYINKSQTKLLCTSIASRNKFEAWSQDNMGTVSITSRPQDRLSFMDRVTLIDLETFHSEVLDLSKNRSNNQYFSFTTYEPIKNFYAYLFNGDSSPLIYLTPSDYQIAGNKIILNQTISYKSRYDSGAVTVDLSAIQNPSISLLYVYNPTYYVIDINRDVIRQKDGKNCLTMQDNVTNFPLNAVGRRCHYVVDAPDFSGDSVFDNTNYNVGPPNYDY